MSIKIGLFLPSGACVEPEPVFFEGHKSLQEHIGGHFDVVRCDMGHPEQIAILGYVHDEGLLLNLPMNYLATALFKRHIVGDVVVTWGLSPDGEYDGDDYDFPEEIMEYLQHELLQTTAEAYNQSTNITLAMAVAISQKFVTEDEVTQVATDLYDSRGSGDKELEKATVTRLNEILEFVVEYQKNNPEEFHKLIIEINQQLGED
ncbi:hypothetical protein UFOVP587_36 [uncultured Caudovirales phage]|uniref:DUF3846 domain-containing protein n=1 Tax=uncultured Caudovirales phage TaxID=2100421 RepID=A0A6J5MZ49_9CAUD|nr:hypothetical protein UFOVP587_36 [uncultured Caudovirales phage]